MSTQRAHIILPEDLAQQIDKLVGPRGRSAFLVETARAEVKRRNLLEFLLDPTPAWREEDHPEFEGGDAQPWIRALRQEWERDTSMTKPSKKPMAVARTSPKRKGQAPAAKKRAAAR